MCYQTERVELEYADMTGLVIRALLKCAVAAIPAVPLETPRAFVLMTSAVT